jgi:hypothetical protein
MPSTAAHSSAGENHCSTQDGPIVAYEIVAAANGWSILQNDRKIGALDTRMAAFNSILEAAMTDMLSGHGVTIKIPQDSK